jgi:hypothetical protein
MSPSKITIATIHELKQQMEEASEYEANDVSMVRAIQLLAPHIRAMKTKGYTMDQVARTLTSVGIPIAATTLKSYLSRFTVVPDPKPLPGRRRDGTQGRASSKSSP